MKPRIDVIRICTETDTDPDLSYLGEYGDTDRLGAVDRKEEGDLDCNECRYWYPSTNHYPHNPKNWAHVPLKDKMRVVAQYGSLAKADYAYMMQDYRRMEAYNRGNWSMVGIWAEAQVSYPANGNLGSRRLETLRSAGLWGIESDSKGASVAEVTREELADLRQHLETFGVDISDFEEKAAEAAEVTR